MKEYRVMAYFSEIYSPRSYKRKTVGTLYEAEKLFKEAEEYYASDQYHGHLDRVVIESREVTEWR